mgnify:CR=1 FL=1
MIHPLGVSADIRYSTNRLEAAGLSEMGENTAEDPGFRVPAVDWPRTAKCVLTMEWITGRKLIWRNIHWFNLASDDRGNDNTTSGWFKVYYR